MKKLKLIFAFIIFMNISFCSISCSFAEPKTQNKSAKQLVIYYSFTGNSQKIAKYAKQKLNADILKLEPKTPFSTDYDTVVKQWQKNDIKRDVEIKAVSLDLTKYNKIVLITCVWWYGISPVMKKFLKDYDLSNKDIIVAASNAGWVGHSFKDYKTLLPNSNIKATLNLVFGSGEKNRHELKTTYKEIDVWLNKL